MLVVTLGEILDQAEAQVIAMSRGDLQIGSMRAMNPPADNALTSLTTIHYHGLLNIPPDSCLDSQ